MYLGSRYAQSSYRCISFNHYVLMCCAASLEHLSYPTCVPRKRPEKITSHLRNVCYKVSQLDKNNFKDASEKHFQSCLPQLIDPLIYTFSTLCNAEKQVCYKMLSSYPFHRNSLVRLDYETVLVKGF